MMRFLSTPAHGTLSRRARHEIAVSVYQITHAVSGDDGCVCVMTCPSTAPVDRMRLRIRQTTAMAAGDETWAALLYSDERFLAM
jgi:hypothetical protein